MAFLFLAVDESEIIGLKSDLPGQIIVLPQIFQFNFQKMNGIFDFQMDGCGIAGEELFPFFMDSGGVEPEGDILQSVFPGKVVYFAAFNRQGIKSRFQGKPFDFDILERTVLIPVQLHGVDKCQQGQIDSGFLIEFP